MAASIGLMRQGSKEGQSAAELRDGFDLRVTNCRFPAGLSPKPNGLLNEASLSAMKAEKLRMLLR